MRHLVHEGRILWRLWHVLCAPATYDVNTSAKLSSSFTTSASVKLLINSLAIHFYSFFNDIFKHPVVTLCPTGRQNLWPVKWLVFRISLAWAKRKICRQIGLHAGPGQACVDVPIRVRCPFSWVVDNLLSFCSVRTSSPSKLLSLWNDDMYFARLWKRYLSENGARTGDAPNVRMKTASHRKDWLTW